VPDSPNEISRAFKVPENMVPVRIDSGGFALLPMERACTMKLIPSESDFNAPVPPINLEPFAGNMCAFQSENRLDYFFAPTSIDQSELKSLLQPAALCTMLSPTGPAAILKKFKTRSRTSSTSSAAETVHSSPSAPLTSPKLAKTPSLESLARFMCRSDSRISDISSDTEEKTTSCSIVLKAPRKRSLVEKPGTFENTDAKSKKSRLDENERLVRTSLFRGVGQCGKDRKFQSRIRFGSRVRYLGRYTTEIEAALVYDTCARKLRGEETPTNFTKMDDETENALKAAFIENGHTLPQTYFRLVTPGVLKNILANQNSQVSKREPEEPSLINQQKRKIEAPRE